jgi:hypothetical protein
MLILSDSRWMTGQVKYGAKRRPFRVDSHSRLRWRCNRPPFGPSEGPGSRKSADRGTVPRHTSVRPFVAVTVRDQLRANKLQNGGGIGESLLDIGDLWVVRGPRIRVHHCVRCQSRGCGGKRSKALVDVLASRNKYSNIVGSDERLLLRNQESLQCFLSGLLRVIGRSSQECARCMEEDPATRQIFVSVRQPLMSVRECLRPHRVADRRAAPRPAATRHWIGRQTQLA